MALGLGSSLVKGGASLLTFVKDNLKLYLDFTSNKSDTLKFPSEGSTEFDGTEYIQIQDSDNLSFDNYTVSFWAKFYSVSGGIYGFINKYDEGTSSKREWRVIFEGGVTKFVQYNSASQGQKIVANTTSESANVWNHYAFTHDGSTMTAYRNGIAEGTTTTGGDDSTLNKSDRDVLISAYFNNGSVTNGQDFHGQLANLAVWSRCLESEEIQSIMNKSYSQLKGVETTSLEAWWALDDVQKTTDNSVSSGLIESETGEILSSDVSSFNSIAGTGNNYTNNIIEFVANGYAFFNISGVAQGKLYRFTYNVLTQTASGMSHSGGSSAFTGGIPTTVGSHEQYLVAGSANLLVMRSQGFRGTITDIVIQEVSNTGVVTGATTTTSVYGGNAPILPRAVDVAKEGQADAIGNGSARFNTVNINGTDRISIEKTLVLGTNDFTMTAWANSIGGDSGYQGVVSIGTATNNQSAYMGILSSNEWGFGLFGANYDFGYTVVNGEWHHLAMTREGSNIKLYFDGILVDTQSAGSLDITDGGTHIASIGDNDTYNFNGDISQVGIWQGALTQAQIQSVMESTSYSKIPADVKSTLGSELVTNGSFDSDTTGWSNSLLSSAPTISHSDGKAVVTYSGSDVNVGIHTTNNPLSGITGLVKVTGYAKVTSGSISSGTLRIQEMFGTDASLDWDGENFTAYMLADGATDDIALFVYANNITIEFDNISVKEVTNDIVAYYPLDGSSSRGNGTDDVTTGEVLGNEMVNDTDFTGDGALDNPWRTTQAGWNYNTTENRIEYNDINDGHGAYQFDSQMANSFVAGQLYRAKFTIGGLSSGVAKFRVYDSGLVTTYVDGETTGYGNGTHYAYFVTPSSNISGLVIYGKTTSTSSWYMTEFSIKEVTSNTGVLK
jgi:hypothetical protein